MKKRENKVEIRQCECGCGMTFECSIFSSKRFVHGHNNRGKTLSTKGMKRSEEFKEKIRQFNLSDRNPRRRKRETRECACGCKETFVCKVSSTKRFITGHNSKLFTGKNNPCFGKVYTQEMREMLSRTLRGKKRTIEQRAKYSIGAVNRIIKYPHTIGIRGKGGYVTLNRLGKKIYCHSSYEKKAVKHIDNCLLVVDIEKDAVRIPYLEGGITRTYFVDFKLTLSNGNVCLVEVKSDYGITVSLHKILAGFKYAQNKGYFYQVWTKSICFNQDSVTTMLNQVTGSATASALTGRRYSLNSLATARVEGKPLDRLEEEMCVK